MWGIIERSCEQVASRIRSGSNDMQINILWRAEGLILSEKGLGKIPIDTLVYYKLQRLLLLVPRPCGYDATHMHGKNQLKKSPGYSSGTRSLRHANSPSGGSL